MSNERNGANGSRGTRRNSNGRFVATKVKRDNKGRFKNGTAVANPIRDNRGRFAAVRRDANGRFMTGSPVANPARDPKTGRFQPNK